MIHQLTVIIKNGVVYGTQVACDGEIVRTPFELVEIDLDNDLVRRDKIDTHEIVYAVARAHVAQEVIE